MLLNRKVVLMSIVYVAIGLPIEAGFLVSATSVDALFCIDRVIDGIFVVDMAVQFYLIFPQHHAGRGIKCARRAASYVDACPPPPRRIAGGSTTIRTLCGTT